MTRKCAVSTVPTGRFESFASYPPLKWRATLMCPFGILTTECCGHPLRPGFFQSAIPTECQLLDEAMLHAQLATMLRCRSRPHRSTGSTELHKANATLAKYEIHKRNVHPSQGANSVSL